MSAKTRPTKKQHELFEFLKGFITEHGYSPSYREIMKGCGYASVATVALHVGNLIKRGHVIKRSNSARSLEIVAGVKESSNAKSNHKNEIISEIEQRFESMEKGFSEEIMNEIYVLVGALKILGHQDIARIYAGRISKLV